MRLDVAVVPDEAIIWADKVIVMVDVIRTSSTIVTLFDLGCRYVFPMSDSHDALIMAEKLGLLSIGERDGEAISGFRFNNSPLQLMSADIREKDVVLSTTNGTLALEKVMTDKRNVVMIGSALNAAACVRMALARALTGRRDLGIVCAGRNGGFALDDVVCAGLLVERIINDATSEGIIIDKLDGAKGALRLFYAYPSLMAAFLESESGNILKQLKQEGDLDLCSQTDISKTVPMVSHFPGVTGLRIHGQIPSPAS